MEHVWGTLACLAGGDAIGDTGGTRGRGECRSKEGDTWRGKSDEGVSAEAVLGRREEARPRGGVMK